MEGFVTIDAEEALCGGVLLEEKDLSRVLGAGFRAEELQGERTRRLFETMVQMQAEGRSLNIVTVRDRIDLPQEYLIGLLYQGETCGDPMQYVSILRKRNLHQEAQKLMLELSESGADPVDLLDRLRELTVRQAALDGPMESGEDTFRRFANGIQKKAYKPVPTGMASLDALLEGGLRPQELVILGGAPGIGKTAFAQQVFEAVAEGAGRRVLYFNLEMSREQLYARSISRQLFDRDISVREILSGDTWNTGSGQAIEKTCRSYMDRVAPYIRYNPQKGADLNGLISTMTAAAMEAKGKGEAAPMVVIDYLQLIEGDRREDQADTVKRAVKALKSYAIRFDTTVFVIIANNRESNRSGLATVDSGRDTSAIEYSADTMLQLVYTACLDKSLKMTPEDILSLPDPVERRKRKSDVTLRLVKHRGGEAGGTVRMRFDGKKSLFSAWA